VRAVIGTALNCRPQ